MSRLTVLVGLPGSGKSTLISQAKDAFIYSTDDYIEGVAVMKGKTYSDVFQDHIKEATAAMNTRLKDEIAKGGNVIWDQTNMSDKKRRSILSQFPKTYTKSCICIRPPSNIDEWKELKRRLDSRPGKNIPWYIVQSMAASFVAPTKSEGFDHLTFYNMISESGRI